MWFRISPGRTENREDCDCSCAESEAKSAAFNVLLSGFAIVNQLMMALSIVMNKEVWYFFMFA